MLSRQETLDLARKHGYTGGDDPRSELEEEQLATALQHALEAKEGRRLTEWHGIRRGAQEIIEWVRASY